MTSQSDNDITNPSHSKRAFSNICDKRFSRRSFVKSSVALGVGVAIGNVTGCRSSRVEGDVRKVIDSEGGQYPSSFDFIEIEHGIDDTHHVAPDHQAEVLLRWGDPIFPKAPEFDVNNQTPLAQLQQFGYNNDYVGYLSLPPKPGQRARALLCVNHEYPIHGLMFPDFSEAKITAEQVDISKAACGNSIVEINLQGDQWSVDTESKYNRRISALDTEIEFSGPVAGHPRLRTSADPEGKTVIGTFNNCAGGLTPWGTYLTCEENFSFHFSGDLQAKHTETQNHKRYNVPTDLFHWGKHDQRFDVGVEPNEPNRFGWVVEIDPLDPTSTPKKRTAMGRFKHEGGENVIAPDGRLVVYMGDDQRFEYLYKFVTDDAVDEQVASNNRDLLDKGTLYVAKFYAEGHIEWLPLVYENQLLQSDFASQADILLEPRRAADLLGATPMDRPEDVVPNSNTGKVYVMLTNNTKRNKTNAANPRADNRFGHIIEISEINGDFAGTRSEWDLLVKCGNPDDPSHDAHWNTNTSENGWFASPDNGVLDPQGRLWVSTDQSSKIKYSGTNDGLWAMETDGPLRGTGKMFFRVPSGAEMCGPAFSDDGESLFLAVQHPGDREDSFGGVRFNTATTRWPDFDPQLPPRPSLVVVRKKAGGVVG